MRERRKSRHKSVHRKSIIRSNSRATPLPSEDLAMLNMEMNTSRATSPDGDGALSSDGGDMTTVAVQDREEKIL
eukprot:UN13109